MKIDIFNIDDFIKQNHCEEVTDPIFFDGSGNPRDGSLFSYTIFGMSDDDRKNKFGYVDLVGRDSDTHYLHPLVYLIISRLGSISKLIDGTKFAVIEDGKISLVPEGTPNSSTGTDFLYENWEKINWSVEDDDSNDKKSRLKFLKILDKNEIFITKWLIMPPYYREQSSGSKSLGDSINELYKTLLSRTNSMRLGGRFSFFGQASKFRIQTSLVELYLETTRVIKGKDSMLRKNLLGKNIDYTASNVITSPQNSSAETVNDMPVKFGYGLFPLPTLLSLFQPFFVNKISDFYTRILVPLVYELAKGDIKKIDYSLYNVDAAEKVVKLFIKAPTERFKPLEFEYTNKANEKIVGAFSIYEAETKADAESNKWLQRPMTLADMLVLIAAEVLDDKHVYVTRYPVTNFKNIYPSKINIATTSRTRELFLKFTQYDNKYFHVEKYPYIKWDGNPKPKSNIYYDFMEVFVCGNQYLSAIGGDYDSAIFNQEYKNYKRKKKSNCHLTK